MRKVIAIGETVYDIIFKNEQPIGAFPGGSSFNAAIALSRCKVPVTFVGETANDRLGHNIRAFLQQNGVDTAYMQLFDDTPTSLALAFLNQQNDSQYQFYKFQPHTFTTFSLPTINADDVLLIGSYYAVNPQVRRQVLDLLELAHKNGAVIYYDVNFRASHRNDVMKVTPNLIENLEYADVVRGCLDDFEILYRKNNPEKIYKDDIAFYCKKFICTNGPKNVTVCAENAFNTTYEPTPVDTVSTVGAGDNFNAGFIYGLLKENITKSQLDAGLTPEQWNKLIKWAMHFAGECCKSMNNYVSNEFANSLSNNIL